MGDLTQEGREIVNADASMASLISEAEINQQVATAHKYPRSVTHFRKSMMEMVSLSEAIAEECLYSLPRDGKTIIGPSARFAELVASAWGNSRSGARVVNEGDVFITAQGVFHDLERNVAITYEVQRRIVDRQNRKFKPDMIGVTANAACSIALRNAILKGVPKAFWTEMFDRVQEVIRGDFETLPNRRAKSFQRLQTFGITTEQAIQILDVKGENDIGLDQLVVLRGIITSLKNGDTTVEQLLAASNGTATSAGIKPPQSKSGASQKPTEVAGGGNSTSSSAASIDKPKPVQPVTSAGKGASQIDLMAPSTDSAPGKAAVTTAATSTGSSASSTASEDNGTPMTAGALGMIKRKMEEFGYDEGSMKFEHPWIDTIDGLTAAQGSKLFDWFRAKAAQA